MNEQCQSGRKKPNDYYLRQTAAPKTKAFVTFSHPSPSHGHVHHKPAGQLKFAKRYIFGGPPIHGATPVSSSN